MKFEMAASVSVCLFLVIGCAESSQVDGTGGATSTSGSSHSATGATTTAATTGATSVTSSGATTSGGFDGVVINELSGTGSDYIELFNAGAAMADLSGIRIADQDSTAPGMPKLSSSVTLPQGTSLPAGAYLFILGGQATSPGTPQTTCAPGPAPCFYASYKLSNKNGDAVFIVDPSDKVLETVTYPGNLTSGQTWGRLPNGTGPFAVTAATPGAANAAP